MATEERKLENRTRVTEYTLIGLAAALWNMVGESAMAMCAPIGEEILKLMEKEMGLEIAGESPEAMLNEIGRLFIDEFGFCKQVKVECMDKTYTIYAKDATTSTMPRRLKEAAVEKYFISPGLLICLAAFKRLNIKVRGETLPWPEGKGLKVVLHTV